VWIPIALLFLCVGAILGFQVAQSHNSLLPTALRQDPYSLHLRVAQSGDSVLLNWKPTAAPIHSQAKGVLTISEGGSQKIVNLDADQLRTGALMYRRNGNEVQFRLEVQTADRVSVTETVLFRIYHAR
jgi:hypothetical protein